MKDFSQVNHLFKEVDKQVSRLINKELKNRALLLIERIKETIVEGCLEYDLYNFYILPNIWDKDYEFPKEYPEEVTIEIIDKEKGGGRLWFSITPYNEQGEWGCVWFSNRGKIDSYSGPICWAVTHISETNFLADYRRIFEFFFKRTGKL